jgi:large subunit ribosomal protein L10
MKLEDKKAIVDEVSKVASLAVSAVAVDYRGLTVAEMTDLRANARKTGVYLKVLRNTLAKLALQNTQFTCLSEALKGPVFLAFSKEDPGAVARLLQEATAKFEKLTVKALAIGDKLFAPSAIDAIAKLPTKNQAIASLMAVMQAPIGKMVRTLAESYAQVVRIVAAVRDQKQAA